MLSTNEKNEIDEKIRKAVRRHELEAIFIHTPVMLVIFYIFAMWMINRYAAT